MRVVSLVPSFTETLFALGLTESEVVGATKWCVHPADRLVSVARVGGTKDPDVARILDLAPDVVVANREENRREDVEALESGGVRVLVTDVASVGEAAPAIVDVGAAVGRREDALALGARIESTIERVRNAARGTRVVPLFCPIWRRPWMGLGGDTFAHSVLELVGARNVTGDLARYPEVSPVEARARGAEAALLPSEPYPFKEKHVGELVEAGFARERVRLVDGEFLTWYGARMIEGLPAIAGDVDALRNLEAPAKGL